MSSLACEARLRLQDRRAAIERSLPEAPTETAWHELSETQAALDRIERGAYGRCESCGGAIGRQRLLALPAARYCIGCAPRADASAI
jgi:DnaK suppressor protein